MMATSYLVCADASAGDLRQFQTPSGNIHCLASDTDNGHGRMIDCEVLVLNSDRPLHRKPKSCDLDWGHRFILGEAGMPDLACAGDTLRDNKTPVLKFGDTVDVGGDITCEINRAGLRCQNAEAHGFSLSRAKQVFF